MLTTAHEMESNACQTTMIASLSSIVFKPPLHTTWVGRYQRWDCMTLATKHHIGGRICINTSAV